MIERTQRDLSIRKCKKKEGVCSCVLLNQYGNIHSRRLVLWRGQSDTPLDGFLKGQLEFLALLKKVRNGQFHEKWRDQTTVQRFTYSSDVFSFRHQQRGLYLHLRRIEFSSFLNLLNLAT